jgi:hypothetical protein
MEYKLSNIPGYIIIMVVSSSVYQNTGETITLSPSPSNLCAGLPNSVALSIFFAHNASKSDLSSFHSTQYQGDDPPNSSIDRYFYDFET